jgi:drug/metabolite transporter (DMT)-like permease
VSQHVEKTKAYAYLALAMATVGSVVPTTKVIAAAIPPFTASALRLAVAATVLLPWAASRQRSALAQGFDRHDVLLLALQAAAGTVGFTVLMLLGTARTSAADASVVTGTLPAMATLVGVGLFRERPGRRHAGAVALALGGLAVVSLHGIASQAHRSERALGNALVLAAVASESLFILLNKRLHRPLPALAQSAVMSGLGLLYTLPVALVEVRAFDLRSVTAPAWMAVAYYGLVPTVLGFVWWYKGAQHVTSAEAGVFTAVMPLAGAGLSALVLGEPLGIQHAAGLALVVSAIALASMRSAPAAVRAHRGGGIVPVSTAGRASADCVTREVV